MLIIVTCHICEGLGPTHLNQNDRDERPDGVYPFFVDETDVAVATEEALDDFHTTVPISRPEDFDIETTHVLLPGEPAAPTEPTGNFTSGEWLAIKGDVLNGDRTWGIVTYLSKDRHMEIDGNLDKYPCRTEVIAEVCSSNTAVDEWDAKLMARSPKLLAALQIADAMLERHENGEPPYHTDDEGEQNFAQISQALEGMPLATAQARSRR